MVFQWLVPCPLERFLQYLFECKAQYGNLFARNCVEHGLYHALHKALFLVVVDLENLFTPSH